MSYGNRNDPDRECICLPVIQGKYIQPRVLFKQADIRRNPGGNYTPVIYRISSAWERVFRNGPVGISYMAGSNPLQRRVACG